MKIKTRIEIINRNQQDLIPLINLKYLASDSSAAIYNNDISLFFEPEDYKQFIFTKLEKNSVPMEINVFDKDGVRIIGTQEKDMKLVISNFNEFAFCGSDEEECQTDLEGEGLPKGIVSTRLSYNSETAYYGSIFGTLTYSYQKKAYIYTSPEGNEILIRGGTAKDKKTIDYSSLDPTVLKRVVDNLENLNPQIASEVREITVMDYESIEIRCGASAVGCLSPNRGVILSKNSISDIGDFEHETGHWETLAWSEEEIRVKNEMLAEFIKQNKIKGKTGNEWSEEVKILIEKEYAEIDRQIGYLRSGIITKEQYGKNKEVIEKRYEPLMKEAESNRDAAWYRENNPPPEYYEKLNKALEDLPLVRWRNIAGDVYGKDLGPKVVGGNVPDKGDLANKWADGTDGPRKGCLRPYGCNNEGEDRSVWLQSVRTSPSPFFAPLLDPSSKAYDPRYQQKLDELLVQGSISQENYDRIVQNVPTTIVIPVKIRMKDGNYAIIQKPVKE